jgi:hypothetical protein
MGELKDLAKRNSNWLIIAVGESAVVKYIDFKIIPSELDPTKDVVQFKVLEDGIVKYWKNGSGKIMQLFDGLVKGKDWVKITRSPKYDKSGKLISDKTVYDAEKVPEPAGSPLDAPDATVTKDWDN